MDPGELFLKIKELGHINSKRDELRDYCRLKIEQVIKFLSRRILNSDGADVLDCVFNGLLDNPPLCANKVKIVDIVFKTLRTESTSLTHCGDVVSRVCLELPRLPVVNLVRWCDESVQSIVDNSDVNMIWRDVLPECLNAVATHNSITHCGTEMAGHEYKAQCIHTLCQCQWTERQLVQLAAMFKDLQLPKNDHRQVVNKICSYILEISPDTLPPLVHQLLKLCKFHHAEIVLYHLSHYFNLHLYSKLEPPPQDSESTTMDIDDIVHHSPAELSRCLSTCIYHIAQGAADPELIRKHIRMWPKTQLLRAPFLLDLALAVSDKGSDFRSVCLDAIRSAIEQRAMEELCSKQSACVRSALPPDVDVASVLKVLTTESANHRELTVLGLINLAFSLLSVSRLKPVAQVCWSHGKLILVRLCKSQPETAGHILSLLGDKLCGDTTQRQYSDCLYILCKLTPVSVERCTQLGAILESCRPSATEFESGARVLDAVHPLLAFSSRSRDALVLVCRKGLYSRDSLHRCLALSGFLTVLRHTKVSSGSVGGSQCAGSQQCGEQLGEQLGESNSCSYLTQLAVDLHATRHGATVTSRVRNEAMCLEVISMLRRCLVQDSAVKQLLYSQLYDCTKDKPVLHEPILELLYEHLTKYLTDDEDALQLDKCVQTTATSAVLTEPIATLLYAVAQFVQPTEDEDLEDILASQSVETGSAHLRNKLKIIMEKLCKNSNFAQIDMEDPGLTDLTPESKAKSLKVQQILQCHEALIAHQIMQWNVNSDNVANTVYRLFKNCNELLEQTKTPSKLGKKSSKANLNDTRDSAKTQKSQKSQKDKGKGKLSNMVKDKAGPFKPLPCVWDLKFCLRILDLLYSEEVPWSNPEQRKQVRARRDLHRWALRGARGRLAARGDWRALAAAVVKIAALLYTRCVRRFQDLYNFDDQTALGCLEVFKSCLNLILFNNYSLKTDTLLSNIAGVPEGAAAILQSTHAALIQLEEDSAGEETDATAKKIFSALCQIAIPLLETPTQSSADMNRAIIQFEDYVRRSKQDCLQLLGPVLAAGCREQHEAQLLSEVLQKLAIELGRIDEEDSSVEETASFPGVDASSGHAALSQVCGQLGRRRRCAQQLLARARDLAAHRHQHRIDRELSELYKCIVVQLCQLSSWTTQVARLRCSVGGSGGSGGGGSDRVVSLCARLYALLAAFARQLPPAMAPTLKLERLLKLCGRRLSSATDSLISYVEHAQPARRPQRDARLVPRLVLEAEQFARHVALLASRAKVNYQQYLSLGTARDFRIKAPVLQEMLDAMEQEADDHGDTDDQDINDAATEVIPRASDNEDDDNGSEEETSRRKRLKT